MNPEPTSTPGPNAETVRTENSERLSARLALISEISRSAHSKLDVGELLNSVAEATRRNFGYYDVSIFLVDPDVAECVLVARSGQFQAEGLEGYRQKLGVGIVGWVAEHGQTVLANDVRQDPRHIFAFEGERESLSELTVPIRLHDHTVGVINIENREANAFQQTDVMSIETLADQMAQAIANAQMFERTRLLMDLNRSIIDAMPSGLCVLDGNWKVQYANPTFCSMTGAQADQIVGRAIGDVLPRQPLEVAGVTAAIERAIEYNAPRLFVDIPMMLGGVDRVLNVRVTPAHMPEGDGVLLVLEDITEWRKAMALAEQRRSFLDLIVSHVPVAVISIDLESRVTFWGAGAERLFGYEESALSGKPMPLDLFEGDQDVRALIEKCRTAASAEGEFSIKRRNGEHVPVTVVMGTLADKERRHVGYTAVLLDITERQRAEMDLLREKKKLDSVVAVIGAGLTLIDRNHKVVWANPTITEWFARDGKVVGLSCHEVFCRRDTPCQQCPSADCFQRGAVGDTEVTLARNDGAIRQYHHAVTPIVGPTGEVEQVLKVTLDVTEQNKKVYQLARLRQFGEMMQTVLDLDHLLHFVLTCVTAGQALGFNRAILLLVDKERNVIEGRMGVGPGSAEEAGRIWTGMSRERVTLEDLLTRFDHQQERPASVMDNIARGISVRLDDPKHIVAQCARARQHIIVQNAQQDPGVSEEFRRQLGSNHFVMAPLIARSETLGVIVADNLYSGQPIGQEHVELLSMFANQAGLAIENAGNYRRLQEEKTHLEKAYRDLAEAQDQVVRTERLAAIGRMAAHVAHEIRNPLTTVGGFAKTIARSPDAPKEEIGKYAQIIVSEVRRLENILARVMDFTKPPKPLFREGTLGEILRQTADQFKVRADSQRVEMRIEMPAKEVPMQMDPDQMKQVFINLFQNALDVMKDGGQLTARVQYRDHRVVIAIRNTGEPIRPEDMHNLFEPFFSTKPGGTGLGLAVCQKIIQDHGGDIRVISDARGTEFTISLPLDVRQKPPSSPYPLPL